MPISASDAIEPAFRHTKDQLFRPFRLGQWMRLAFVGLLAGEMGSFGGCNFSYPVNTHQRGSHQFLLQSAFPAQLAGHAALIAGLVAVAVVIVIGLAVLFTYISSVMRFILFDSIVARECHIRQGWARRRRIGFRLFLWQLLFMLATSVAFLVVIGVPALWVWSLGWFAHARDHVLGFVLGGLILFFVFAVLLVFVAVVTVMTKDFVVPQMAFEDISVMEGWRRLWLWLKYDKGGYAGYIGMKIVLAIGATIALAIVTLVAFLLLLIPIGGVGVAAVLGGRAAGWTWNPYTITAAVVFGCIAIMILILAAALIAVPAIVFFPAYSIYFFASRYSQLGMVVLPQPPAPAAPG